MTAETQPSGAPGEAGRPAPCPVEQVAPHVQPQPGAYAPAIQHHASTAELLGFQARYAVDEEERYASDDYTSVGDDYGSSSEVQFVSPSTLNAQTDGRHRHSTPGYPFSSVATLYNTLPAPAAGWTCQSAQDDCNASQSIVYPAATNAVQSYATKHMPRTMSQIPSCVPSMFPDLSAPQIPFYELYKQQAQCGHCTMSTASESSYAAVPLHSNMAGVFYIPVLCFAQPSPQPSPQPFRQPEVLHSEATGTLANPWPWQPDPPMYF
jgi:hypothetical protein